MMIHVYCVQGNDLIELGRGGGGESEGGCGIYQTNTFITIERKGIGFSRMLS